MHLEIILRRIWLAIKERGVKRTCQACGEFSTICSMILLSVKVWGRVRPRVNIKKSKNTASHNGEEEVKIENDDADASDDNDIAEVELEEDNDDVILPDDDDDVDVVEDDR